MSLTSSTDRSHHEQRTREKIPHGSENFDDLLPDEATWRTSIDESPQLTNKSNDLYSTRTIITILLYSNDVNSATKFIIYAPCTPR